MKLFSVCSTRQEAIETLLAHLTLLQQFLPRSEGC
jgi:hypothetical protein